MSRVVITRSALDDLHRLTRTHSLPADTPKRLARSLSSLRDFPELGSELPGRWSGFRFLLGPWRWMICVYVHDPESDMVSVVTIQDGRSSEAATAGT